MVVVPLRRGPLRLVRTFRASALREVQSARVKNGIVVVVELGAFLRRRIRRLRDDEWREARVANGRSAARPVFNIPGEPVRTCPVMAAVEVDCVPTPSK